MRNAASLHDGESDLRCSWGMYKYQYQRVRGKRSKAATCTKYKYIAASCKPFSSGQLRLPAHILGRVQRRSCQAIHPSIHPTETKPLYLTSTKGPTYLARIQKSYNILHTSTRTKVLCLLCLLKIVIVIVVVVVSNDNMNSCQNKVGYQEGGSGDISSLASCCLTLTPAFHCTFSPSVLR